MKKSKTKILVLIVFYLSSLLLTNAFSQTQVPVITLSNGAVINMTQQQLQLMISQPGIIYSQQESLPTLVGEQIAIPLPSELGGGYIIGTPESIAAALNNTGIATGVTASSVLNATAASGSIVSSGSLAGSAVLGGVTAGTVALGAGIAAAIIGGVIAITGDEDGGGVTVTHITTSHH